MSSRGSVLDGIHLVSTEVQGGNACQAPSVETLKINYSIHRYQQIQVSTFIAWYHPVDLLG